MKTTNNIPELSFIDIENGDALATSLLSEALKSHGFFSITHHGLSQDVLDSCYKSSRDFFNLQHSRRQQSLFQKVYNPLPLLDLGHGMRF